MSISNQRGTILVFLISGIAMAAAIGIGMFYMKSTQTLGQAFGSETNRAYYLALAAKEYVISQSYNPSIASAQPFIISNTERFYVAYSNGQFTSTGVVNEGTAFEARRTITVPLQSPWTP